MMVAEGLARYGLMNTDRAARRLGISKNGVTGAIGRGALRADKVKGQWEISEEAVEEYEANHLGRRGQISREKAAERAAKTSQTAMEKRITNEMLWKWMQQQSEVNEAVLQRLDRVDLRPGSEPSDPDMDLRAELADLKSRVDQIEERLRNLGRLISGE